MVLQTRRRLLRSVAASVAALAGCSGSNSHSQSVPRRETPANVESDPEAVTLRRAGENPPAWLRPEGAEVGDDDTETESPPRRTRGHGLVASEDAAARLRFADVTGADDARQFVAETDFERETLYLEPQSVRACYRLELCYITWSASDVETQFGSYYRDAEASCRVDVRESTAWLIRIPDALDPEEITSHGSGWSSRGCGRPPWNRTREEARTPVPARPLTGANATEEGDR